MSNQWRRIKELKKQIEIQKEVTKDLMDIFSKEACDKKLSEENKQLQEELNELRETMRNYSVIVPETEVNSDYINPACEGCANHPSNGGSGFCHCTLGQNMITC